MTSRSSPSRIPMRALGIDIGGGKVRAGAGSPEAAPAVYATPKSAEELIALIRRLFEEARRPDLLGVGVPGVPDTRSGVIRRSVNLPWLEGFPLRKRLEEVVGPPEKGIKHPRLLLDSDVNVATWAQWEACGFPARFVYLSIGTGVGGGVVLKGDVVRHTNGGAGHFGFLLTDPRQDAAALEGDAPGSLSACVAAFCQGQRDVTTRPYAARAIAIGAAQIARIYDPDVIAVGGGALDHDDALFPEIERQIPLWRGGVVGCHYEVRRAPLSSDQAGVTGAVAMALHAWELAVGHRFPRSGHIVD
ncbi:MAG: ROK family protein [Phycisphaerales bacterium]|nr:ROK family protein [Phycisphaerales bacterium]